MFYVDDVVADGEVAEVREEGSRFRLFGCGPGVNVGFIREVVCTEQDEVGIGEADAGFNLRTNNDRDAEIACEISKPEPEMMSGRTLRRSSSVRFVKSCPTR